MPLEMAAKFEARQPTPIECLGCGAPRIRYQHVCDYCKRPS